MMVKLRGHVKHETEKAILFEVSEDIHLHLNGLIKWFPKSNIRLPKILHGKEISIYVQNWFYNSLLPLREQEM